MTDLNSGRTPGPDGFPVEFLKQYWSHLLPHLLDLLHEAVEWGSLPPNMDRATIVVIPKTEPPTENCASYRPISLINADDKVFAKDLAIRLGRTLPHLGHPDQCGFTRGS